MTTNALNEEDYRSKLVERTRQRARLIREGKLKSDASLPVATVALRTTPAGRPVK